MIERSPVFKDLVLIGGGHANIQVLKKMAMKPIKGLRVTLISNVTQAPYSGMLPRYLTGWYKYTDIHFDLRKLCEQARARFICAAVVNINSDSKTIFFSNRPAISYDVASLNIGISPRPLKLAQQGNAEFFSLKPISQFLVSWHKFLEDLQKTPPNKKINVAVVGGGAAGCETAIILANTVKKFSLNASVKLFCRGSRILSNHNYKAQKLMYNSLAEQGVEVYTEHEAIALKNKQLKFVQQDSHKIDYVFGATEAQAAPWLKDTDLILDENGFIKVNSHLQVENTKGLFAAGDCISFQNYNLPKAGVYAVRQGPVLYDNIFRSLVGKKLRSYHPQKRILALINSSPKKAIASYGAFAFNSSMMWKFKDNIDRRFMKKFNSLPEINDNKPMPFRASLVAKDFEVNTCGGCGSKIGGGILRATLEKLYKEYPQLLSADFGHDDAAMLEVSKGLHAHSVDSFKAFINDPYTSGRIATEHALSDIYAMGSRPKWASVLIGLPRDSNSKTAEELYQVMSGIAHQLSFSKTQLVGGHTYESESLNIGLSLLSHSQSTYLAKSGVRSGDALILTKALGTGALFKANMLGKVNGDAIEAALQQMQKSQHLLVDVFKKYEVHALTDITGFGLAGHLLEMLQDSHLQAHLDIQKINILAGFKEAVNMGHYSFLSHENEAAYSSFISLSKINKIQHTMLYDPQTAGGFLLALAPEKVEDVLVELRSKGFEQAQCIGQICSENHSPSPISVS